MLRRSHDHHRSVRARCNPTASADRSNNRHQGRQALAGSRPATAERAQISSGRLKSGKHLPRSTPIAADSSTAPLSDNFRNRAVHNQPQRSRHSNPHNARRTTNVSLPAVSSIGGLRTPAPLCAAPPSWGRHPKTFTTGDIPAPKKARKNAKSALTGGVSLYCLTCDGEVGPQVKTAATTGGQARIVFDVAWK